MKTSSAHECNRCFIVALTTHSVNISLCMRLPWSLGGGGSTTPSATAATDAAEDNGEDNDEETHDEPGYCKASYLSNGEVCK